jgi:orotate phosphoribosyltransferase
MKRICSLHEDSMADPLYGRIEEVSWIERSFLLRSGQTANHYFDKRRFEGDPALLRELSRRMLALIPSDTRVLAGLALGGVPLVTACPPSAPMAQI